MEKKEEKKDEIEGSEEKKETIEDLREMEGKGDFKNLISEEDLNKMAINIDKALEYLDKIGIEDIKVERDRFVIIISFEYDRFNFVSHLVIAPEWFLFKTLIFELEDVAEPIVPELLAEILKGNFILNGVVYGLDPENKGVWVQSDIPAFADFNIFKINYFSNIMAIDYFMKNIVPKLKIEPKKEVYKPEKELVNWRLYI